MNESDHSERRRKWDVNRKERLSELERKWRERQIEIIREQLQGQRIETGQSNRDSKT